MVWGTGSILQGERLSPALKTPDTPGSDFQGPQDTQFPAATTAPPGVSRAPGLVPLHFWCMSGNEAQAGAGAGGGDVAMTRAGFCVLLKRANQANEHGLFFKCRDCCLVGHGSCGSGIPRFRDQGRTVGFHSERLQGTKGWINGQEMKGYSLNIIAIIAISQRHEEKNSIYSLRWRYGLHLQMYVEWCLVPL